MLSIICTRIGVLLIYTHEPNVEHKSNLKLTKSLRKLNIARRLNARRRHWLFLVDSLAVLRAVLLQLLARLPAPAQLLQQLRLAPVELVEPLRRRAVQLDLAWTHTECVCDCAVVCTLIQAWLTWITMTKHRWMYVYMQVLLYTACRSGAAYLPHATSDCRCPTLATLFLQFSPDAVTDNKCMEAI